MVQLPRRSVTVGVTRIKVTDDRLGDSYRRSRGVTMSSGRTSRRIGRARLWAASAAAIAVMLVGYGLRPVSGSSVPPAAAARPTIAPGYFQPDADQWRSLTFAPVEQENFADHISAIGSIAADDDTTVQVTPPFSGRVLSVLVRGGERVHRGQPLLIAEATEVGQARSDLLSAETAVRTASAQLAVASANAERQHKLIAIGGAATRDVQQADSDLVTAQSQSRANTAALALVRQRLSILQAGGAGGAKAVVRAPIAGIVTLRQVGPGQFLNATSNGNATPIFTISDDGRVWLTADIREEDADSVRVEAPIEATVAGQRDRLRAHLDFVATAVDPVSRRLLVHATLPNPDLRLKANTYADVEIETGRRVSGLAVPGDAVVYEGDTAHVWVTGPNHTLAIREVRPGKTAGGKVEILSGLVPGDHVVSAGALFIDRAAKPS